MATDWAADVKRYVADAEDEVIAGIVRYCGIALQKRDSSLVSMSDAIETGRVRENFLKKKLGLSQSDAELNGAIAEVGQRMKADNFKNRVTVYYLLADRFGMHDLFRKGAAKTGKAGAGTAAAAAGGVGAAGVVGVASLASIGTKRKAPAKTDKVALASTAPAAVAPTSAPKAPAAATSTPTAAAIPVALAAVPAAAAITPPSSPAAAIPVAAAAAAAIPAAAAMGAHGASGTSDDASTRPQAMAAQDRPRTYPADDEAGGMGWVWWVLGALALALLLWWLFMRQPAEPTTTPNAAASVAEQPAAAMPADGATAAAMAGAAADASGADLAAAPAEGSVTIPTGAGVTTETRDGKPVAKVYFDTGKTAVVPAFAATAAGLKAYLASHAGSSLAVSGYNDPTGNAAANAALSKNRAKAVQAALVAAGIPDASAELVKPAATTDTKVDNAGARRVEVVVR